MPHHLRYFYLGFEYASDINCAGVLNIREYGFSLTFTFPIKRQNLWFCVGSCKYGSAKTRKPTKNENCTKIYMIQNLICGIPFFFFWKYYFGHAAFLYLSRRSNWHHHSFSLISDFLAESQSQQKLAKKITHFTIQFPSTILRTSIHLKLKMIPSHNTVKSLSDFTNFPADMFVSCQKKYLHCTLSWRPIIAFLKHFESKCLYITIYLLMKMFLLET